MRKNLEINFLKKLFQTSRPLEKAVVLEMTIKYVRSLQRALHIKSELEMAPRNQFEEGFSSALERLQTFPGIDSKVIQVNF